MTHELCACDLWFPGLAVYRKRTIAKLSTNTENPCKIYIYSFRISPRLYYLFSHQYRPSYYLHQAVFKPSKSSRGLQESQKRTRASHWQWNDYIADAWTSGLLIIFCSISMAVTPVHNSQFEQFDGLQKPELLPGNEEIAGLCLPSLWISQLNCPTLETTAVFAAVSSKVSTAVSLVAVTRCFLVSPCSHINFN